MKHTMIMDLSMAWAAATDVADRRMKKHGRKVWNETDYNYAVKVFNLLCPDPEG